MSCRAGRGSSSTDYHQNTRHANVRRSKAHKTYVLAWFPAEMTKREKERRHVLEAYPRHLRVLDDARSSSCL